MKIMNLVMFFVFFLSNYVIAVELKEDFSWEKYKEIKIKSSIENIESRNLRNVTEKEKMRVINEFEIKVNNFKSLNVSQESINEKFNFAIKKNIQNDSYLSKKRSFTQDEKDMILENAYFDIEMFLSDKLMQIDLAKNMNELQREICTRTIDYDDCTERGIPKDINHNLEMAKKISKTVRCKDIYSQKCFNAYEARLVRIEKEEKERKIKAREAQKKFKRIYQSKKSKKILTCKQKENNFEYAEDNYKPVHSGYLDIMIYNDEPRVIIINSFSTLEGKVLDTKESQFKLNNLNTDEYIIEHSPSGYLPKRTFIYSINAKKNQISFYRRLQTNKINKLLFSASCSLNNKKPFWDLAETPFRVENENLKRALEKKDKKKILSKEKVKKGFKKGLEGLNKINDVLNKLPQ